MRRKHAEAARSGLQYKPIENPQIARVFEEIADCLDLSGDNPFRVRAYRNAARRVLSLDEPLARIAADPARKLTELEGIGEDLAAKIKTLLKTGALPLHQRLCGKIPVGLREMMRVPGLGPKRAVLLSRKLGVKSLDSLRQAALRGRIRELKGFGEKTEKTILAGLTGLPETRRRFLLSEARVYVDSLTAHLRGAPGLSRLEPAGSYRRRKETVGDIDLLAIAPKPDAVMERLASYGGGARVLARGRTKMTVRLPQGLQVDLRVVPGESYGAALQYFTGSQAHSIELRARALQLGLKLNEYGVFKGRRRVAGADEPGVYAALGLPWIAPELREGRGEIALALAGRLPRLLELADLKGDLHMHTTATDGRDSLEAMVAAAEARGYEYVAVTDHSRRVTMAHGLDAARLRAHWRKIDRLQARRKIRVLKGVELDILEDGRLDLPDDVLREADWVLASLHYGQRQPRERITKRLVGAAKHPYVDAIGHPSGRLIGRREPCDCDMDAVMRAAADYGCALELDGQPDRLDLDDVAAAGARERRIRISVDSDAHSVAELGFVENAVFQARRARLGTSDVLNARPLADFRSMLKRAR